MVHLEEDKIIIEISTSAAPEVLSNIQKALITLIQHFPDENVPVKDQPIYWGMELFREMIPTDDQLIAANEKGCFKTLKKAS